MRARAALQRQRLRLRLHLVQRLLQQPPAVQDDQQRHVRIERRAMPGVRSGTRVQRNGVCLHAELVHDGLLCQRDHLLAVCAAVGHPMRRGQSLRLVRRDDAVVRQGQWTMQLHGRVMLERLL